MFKKKVGMIGLGSWGKNIYRNLNYFDVVELVYDNDLNNLNFNLIKNNKITKNINDIFLSKTIDSIIIASPAITHNHLKIIKMFL
jgi:predicted dehydrogenase